MKHNDPPPHSRIEIGRRLTATREALGLRAVDISRATGISTSSWSQYEHGRRFPDLLQILPFAERFGIPLDWIYRGIITAVPFEIAQKIIEFLSKPEAAEPPPPAKPSRKRKTAAAG